MAFVHGKDGLTLLNKNSIAADVRAWTVTHKREISDTTAQGDQGARGIPGLMEGTIEVEGHFNSAATRIHATVNTTVGVDNDLNVTIWPEGGVVGKPALFAKCDTKEWEVEAEVKDAVKLTFEGEAHGMVDIGTSHHNLGAETATGNVASVDNAASSANGGAALLHVTAVSGTTPTLTVKIQHSTDDSVWADLITFTEATASTYEFTELAAGTTVNRYTRATHTIGGSSPSFTYAVSFARR
ncbi:hypothetical protein [Streptomyces sp. NPDC002855]|uniref:hypothetical protein n=1 Tax=Streptomyces sp. NPDC002855 TaxID=3154437 RepID=UPI003318CB3A